MAIFGIFFGLWSSGKFLIFLGFSFFVISDFGQSDIGSAYRSPRTLLAIPQDSSDYAFSYLGFRILQLLWDSRNLKFLCDSRNLRGIFSCLNSPLEFSYSKQRCYVARQLLPHCVAWPSWEFSYGKQLLWHFMARLHGNFLTVNSSYGTTWPSLHGNFPWEYSCGWPISGFFREYSCGFFREYSCRWPISGFFREYSSGFFREYSCRWPISGFFQGEYSCRWPFWDIFSTWYQPCSVLHTYVVCNGGFVRCWRRWPQRL